MIVGLVKFDPNMLGRRVARGVVDGFLRDPVQVRGGRVVVHDHLGRAVELAGDLARVLHGGGQLLQRRHQARAVRADGLETARDLPGFLDRLFEFAADEGGFARAR